MLPGSSARHLCAWKSKEEENVCVYSWEKGLDGNLKKKKGFGRTVLVRLFVFVSHWETKSNFAPFSIGRETETIYVCSIIIRLAGPARLVFPSWTYLRTHIEHIIPTPSNSTVVFCCFFSAAGPVSARPPFEKRKTKKGIKVWDNSKSIRAEYIGTVGKPVGRHQIGSRVNSAQRHTERAAAARSLSVFRCIYRQWCMAQLYLFQQCTI